MTFLEKPREVNFYWHLQQVRKWFEFDRGRHLDSPLVYAALELRCAIERYFFEFLFLLKHGQITPEDEQRSRSIKGLLQLMKETDPIYRQTAKFTNLVARVNPEIPEVTVLELGKLHRYWRELSEYCHWQARPEETFSSPEREFQKKGSALIEEVLETFDPWQPQLSTGVIQVDSMPDEVRDVYEKWAAEEINDEQAIIRLDIMKPVLTRRRLLRNTLQE